MQATSRVLLVFMWGLYLLCFLPFLPTSVAYVALFTTGFAGLGVAIAGLLRHSLYPRLHLLIGLVYLAVYALSIFAPSFSSSVEAGSDGIGAAISRFYRGSAILLRARLDSSDVWTALTIVYAQFLMPALVLIAVLTLAMRNRQGAQPSAM